MAKSVNGVIAEEKPTCPYLQNTSKGFRKTSPIHTDYELKYNEDHEVIIVEVGDRDLEKEVASHIGEVGLYNVIKMALAHGENPYNAFKKDDPGVPFAVDPNATLDEIINDANLNRTKLEGVAKELGVSVDELVKHVNDGTVNQLIENAQETEEQEGE